MIALELDFSDFEKQAKRLRANLDQVPYALSRAMNEALKRTRHVLVDDTWPGHVTQRNAAFIKRALQMKFSNKRELVVEIYDDLGRAHLRLHAYGGTKGSQRRLAIPPQGAVVRTAHGVRRSQTPRAIIDRTPKRALRVTSRGIFVGRGGRLHLMYAFKQTAQQPADVPFERDFAATMAAELRVSFPAALARAMRTRRAR